MKLFVRGNGKFGYLTSAIPESKYTKTIYSMWEANNSMLMSCLINSIEPDIGKTYLFLSSAKDIWDVVKETYFDLNNES